MARRSRTRRSCGWPSAGGEGHAGGTFEPPDGGQPCEGRGPNRRISGGDHLVDESHRAYYEARAREYDDWWPGRGLFAARDRPGWPEEVRELERLLGALLPARTLDVACGTGFLTRCLRGLVVGLDQSASMVALAQRRLPDGVAVVGDALALPFADRSFDRVLAGHFYGHLLGAERERFLDEARRVGHELVVVDSAGEPREEWQER